MHIQLLKRLSQSAFPLLLGTALLLTGCSRPTTMERIEQEGILHVITRNGPTTFYEGRDGPAGFEFELTKLFADYLGVELKLRVATDIDEAYSVLEQNYTHFAALGLSQHATKATSERLRFSTDYKSIQPLVLFKNGNPKPKKVEDLVGQQIAVAAHTAAAAQLQALKQSLLPDLEWEEIEGMETPELMQLVSEGVIDLTIVNSIEFAVHKAIFPNAREGFSLSETLYVSWIFPPGEDQTLILKANDFLAKTKEDGTLLYLQEKYYGHVDQLNFVGARTFINHIKNRLPKFEATFKEAAKKYGIDWRLLAAIGYQESHWRPYATSPTGVRGLMMLTQITAKEMGIDNRLDPEQSIMGGAAYFHKIRQRIPERISEPNRTWMALASYNVGFGHLEDARVLTQRAGFDPDNWIDVKKHLPLLQKKKWYTKTRYGYARGWEPVHYVQNIRRYYDVLSWMMQPGAPMETLAAAKDSQSDQVEDITDSSPDIPLPFKVTPPML